MPHIEANLLTPEFTADIEAPTIRLDIPIDAVKPLLDELRLVTSPTPNSDQLPETLRIASYLGTLYQEHHTSIARDIAANSPMPGETEEEVDRWIRAAIQVGYLRAHGIPATVETEIGH